MLQILVFVLLGSAHAAPTAPLACLDANRVTNELQSEFKFTGPKGAALKLELCDPKSLVRLAFETLLFLKDLPAFELPPSDFNQNLIDGHPYAFFAKRVKLIEIDDASDSDDCPDGRLAYVSPVESTEKKMHICPNALNYDQLTFTSALVHEARHEDGPMYDHAQCWSGPNVDQFSCDNAYSDGGSYAIGLEFLVKLSRNPNLSADIRAAARTLAVIDFTQRFNRPPLDIQQGALMRVTSSPNLIFFDGEKSLDTGLAFPASAVLTLRGGLPTYFDPQTGDVKSYAFRPSLEEASHDILNDEFRQALNKEQQSELIDVVYANNFACLLLKKGLDCFAPNRTEFNVPIEGFPPKRFLYNASSRVFPGDTVFIVDEAGNQHELPASAEDLKKSVALDWPQKPAKLEVLQPWDGGEIAIKANGDLSILSYHTRKWTPVTAFPNSTVQEVLSPFFWSAKLSEL